jgi:predicted nucleic acid-binding protein
MSGGGSFLRQMGVELVETVLADNTTQVVPQSHFSFRRGVELDARRLDKAYSLVDCISMATMRDEGLTDALTNDHHYAQEGFDVLIAR